MVGVRESPRLPEKDRFQAGSSLLKMQSQVLPAMSIVSLASRNVSNARAVEGGSIDASTENEMSKLSP